VARAAIGEGVEFVTCRLCGRTFKAIKWPHLVFVHGLDPSHPIEEYKGLTGVAHTWSRDTLEKTVASHTATLERRGQHWTPERVLAEIRALHARGESLQLAQARVWQWGSLEQEARRFFGSWRAAVRAAGFDPDEEGLRVRWTPESVLETIRADHAAGLDLSAKGQRARGTALINAARRFFGSWRAALAAAGIDPASIYHVRPWTREAVLEDLRRLAPITSREIAKRYPGLCHAIYRLFESYGAALDAAGVPRPARRPRRSAPAVDTVPASDGP